MLTFTNRNTTGMVQLYTLEPIISVLEQGGLILFPTDTIWGIGCDATNSKTVERVRALKQVSRQEPLVILAASIEMLKQYVPFIHPRIETLLLFHLRPLTVIYEQASGLPENALGPDGSVAMRIPHDDFCSTLLTAFGKPIVATSASIGQAPWPHHFGEISSAVIEGIDYVVKHRQMEKTMGEPSVIARLGDDEELAFIRE